MSRWRSVGLVARREILERGRSRGFILSVFFTTALVIGSILLPTLLFADDGVTDLGVIQPAPAGLEATLVATAAQFEREVEVTGYSDAAAATTALEADEVDAVIAVPADLSSAGEIRFQEDADQATAQLIAASIVALRVQVVLAESDVDQPALAAAQVPPAIVAVDERTDADEASFLVANIGAVLILIGIFSFGFTVLTGVVEEKQSRVVEVVLSTVRPRDLLMGKVLGIGILGLVQLVVFVLAGVGAALLVQDVEIPAAAPGTVALLVIWFMLGFALYATALGFLGALASRMEEASNASTPVTVIAMTSYFVAIFAVVEDPSGPVAVVASYLPPSAPFVVPLRAAFDAISPVEIAISATITVAAIWVLFNIGARIYAGAVLQTAARMKLRDAWRSAGE
jgi:ABC-2 type transport system permease protein